MGGSVDSVRRRKHGGRAAITLPGHGGLTPSGEKLEHQDKGLGVEVDQPGEKGQQA